MLMITAHQKIGQLSRVPRWLPAAETQRSNSSRRSNVWSSRGSAKKTLSSSKVKLQKLLDIDQKIFDYFLQYQQGMRLFCLLWYFCMLNDGSLHVQVIIKSIFSHSGKGGVGMASRESLFSTHSILGTGRFWIDSEQKILKIFRVPSSARNPGYH